MIKDRKFHNNFRNVVVKTNRELHWRRPLAIMKVLGNKHAVDLLLAIINYPGITVTEITVALHLQQSIVSQTLRKLLDVQLVKMRKEGKFHHYSVEEGYVAAVLDYVKAISEVKGRPFKPYDK